MFFIVFTTLVICKWQHPKYLANVIILDSNKRVDI